MTEGRKCKGYAMDKIYEKCGKWGWMQVDINIDNVSGWH